jgi:hypothetical protein
METNDYGPIADLYDICVPATFDISFQSCLDWAAFGWGVLDGARATNPSAGS